MVKFILLALCSIAFTVAAEPFRFGYFHTAADGVVATRDYTNLVMILTADPETVSLDDAVVLHPSAQFVLEFGALKLSFRSSTCAYNKCMTFDKNRTEQILDAIEEGIQPYTGRIHSFLIVDEPETNPPTLKAIESLVDAIKARPALANIPLWINYDNVYAGYTLTPFILSNNIDIVSLTPQYGVYCWYQLCETGRYKVLLNAVQQQQPLAKLMVVGDGWAKSPDWSDGSLTATGKAHLYKVQNLYSTASRMANELGISVLGEVVFSYNTPGQYTVASSPAAIRSAWKAVGRSMIEATPIANDPQSVAITIPATTWRFDLPSFVLPSLPKKW